MRIQDEKGALTRTARALDHAQQALCILAWRKRREADAIKPDKRLGKPHFKRDRVRLAGIESEYWTLGAAIAELALAGSTIADFATASALNGAAAKDLHRDLPPTWSGPGVQNDRDDGGVTASEPELTFS